MAKVNLVRRQPRDWSLPIAVVAIVAIIGIGVVLAGRLGEPEKATAAPPDSAVVDTGASK